MKKFLSKTALIAACCCTFVLHRAGAVQCDALSVTQEKPLFSILWKKQLNTLLESNAALANLDSDPEMEIVVPGREELFALDNNGTVLWTYKSEGRYMMTPAVLPTKESVYIYTVDMKGNVVCLDQNKKSVWQHKLKGTTSWSNPAIADLDADGAFELVQADESGTVTAFDAITGKIQWEGKVDGLPSSAAIGDIDGDGKQEIVYFTTTGKLCLLNSNGTTAWEKPFNSLSETWGSASPIIFTDTNGRGRVAIATAHGELICCNAQGETLWTRVVNGAVASTLSVGKIEESGSSDLFLITQLGQIYRFDEEGTMLWEIDMQGRTLRGGALEKVTADKESSYLLSTQNGHFQVLNKEGRTLFSHFFDHRTVNVTPLMGNVSKLSKGNEMIITGGESGWVYCFGNHPESSKQFSAKTKAGSNKNSSTIETTELEAAGLLMGEEIKFEIKNQSNNKQGLVAEAYSINPNGAIKGASIKVIGGETQLFLRPDLTTKGEYIFKWSLRSDIGEVLSQSEKRITIEPFRNEQALLSKVMGKVDGALSRLPKQFQAEASALQLERIKLEQQINALSKEVETIKRGDGKTEAISVKAIEALLCQAKRVEKLADLISQSDGTIPTKSIIPFEGIMWVNGEKPSELPTKYSNHLTLSRKMINDEYEPFSVQLFNPTSMVSQSQVIVGELPKGVTVEIAHSVPTTDALDQLSWDALPPIDESFSVTIPSMESKEIWLTVKTSPECPAGEYTIPLSIRQLTAPDAPAKVEMKLKIYPFESAPSGSFRLCAWGEHDAKTIPNLLSHGANILIVPHGIPSIDSANRLVSVDFSPTEALVKHIQGHDQFLLFLGIPDILNGKAPKPTAAAYLKKLEEYLASKGIDKKHFAFYPIDEPAIHGEQMFNQFLDFCNLIKEIDPTLLNYMDGNGEAPFFKAMQPVVDVWCVMHQMLPVDDEVMQIVRKDKESLLWSYDCVYPFSRPIGAKNKNTNVMVQYRMSAPQAFHYGCDAIGYWCYNHGDELWKRLSLEYPLVYNGVNGPINSRRWEAVREGIEDSRILIRLRSMLKDPESNLSTEAQQKIEHLLNVTLKNYVEKSYKETLVGLDRRTLDATSHPQLADIIRKEMFECIDLVK